jgi:hypothetical protein
MCQIHRATRGSHASPDVYFWVATLISEPRRGGTMFRPGPRGYSDMLAPAQGEERA